jgi:hypothetical protein
MIAHEIRYTHVRGNSNSQEVSVQSPLFGKEGLGEILLDKPPQSPFDKRVLTKSIDFHDSALYLIIVRRITRHGNLYSTKQVPVLAHVGSKTGRH